MGLFDVFTFKKQAQDIFSSQNLQEFLETAKDSIIEQAKAKISGEEKKQKVDQAVIAFIDKKSEKCSNKIILWAIDRIRALVPSITQAIYNLLKEKVENL